jgi:hypothetical protein
MVDNGSDAGVLAGMSALSLFETIFAKEARKRFDCRGKPLDCSELRYNGDCSVD